MNTHIQGVIDITQCNNYFNTTKIAWHIYPHPYRPIANLDQYSILRTYSSLDSHHITDVNLVQNWSRKEPKRKVPNSRQNYVFIFIHKKI